MVLYYEQEMKCWRELKDQVCTELRIDDIDYALGTSWNMSQNERKAALPAIKLTFRSQEFNTAAQPSFR